MIDLRTLLVLIHIIGTVVGAGAATVSDYLFFKFARDGKVDRDEFRILQTVSELVWIGLLILLLSGFGFVLLYAFDHNHIRHVYNIEKIYAKSAIVLVLLINGFVLHRVVLPLFAARLGKSFATPQFIKKSFVIFTAGAVSFVSWYSSLILGGWRGLTAGYWQILGTYVLCLAVAIAGANLLGRALLLHLRRKRK
jgi:hypothetical protein